MDWYYAETLGISFVNPALQWAENMLRVTCPWPLAGTRLATPQERQTGLELGIIRCACLVFYAKPTLTFFLLHFDACSEDFEQWVVANEEACRFKVNTTSFCIQDCANFVLTPGCASK